MTRANLPAEPARPRKPGRPLRREVDEAIVEATVAVLTEKGLRGLTMGDVAARAGVGKATIYRRWPSKEALVAALIRERVAELPAPNTGSVRDDLARYLEALIQLLSRPPAPEVLKSLVAEMARNAALREPFQAAVAARRAITRAILARGVGRGELRADMNYDLALDMLVGPSYFRLLVSGDPIPADYAEQVVDALLAGFAAD